MAHAGVASRRACEELIVAGRVKVNGETVLELGVKVNPLRDRIEVDGQPVQKKEKHVYIKLHKPQGYITTAKDQFQRRSVLDLIRGVDARIYPVGRLDYESEGLLLLTNDGELAHRIMHPTYHLSKTYLVEVGGTVSADQVNKLRTGVILDGEKTQKAGVLIIHTTENRTTLRIEIREGRNRQIRRMCEEVKLDVARLVRTQVGPITLGTLDPGKFRSLSGQELFKLRQAVGLNE